MRASCNSKATVPEVHKATSLACIAFSSYRLEPTRDGPSHLLGLCSLEN
uniref:Lipid-A-disaccharide synthase n=1 Tax=Rhizophora mucronata TaxID=61149 RepID=A0A2P2MRD6_RHIMU